MAHERPAVKPPIADSCQPGKVGVKLRPMARRIPFSEEQPFELRIKSLADDELLDIWVETQELERMLREEWDAELELAPEYERMIIHELQLRYGLNYVKCEL